MLRRLRITLAIIMVTLVTLLFLGLGPEVTHWTGWAAKIQFLPALLALNFIVVAALIILTIIFGRIYCSVICPLGILQDFYSWLGGKFKKNRFSFVKEHKWLRYGILAIFIICLLIGFAPVTVLLAPYSTYGRIVTSFFMKNITVSVIACVVLLLLGILAFLYGRAYCNSICPVGTILSFFSRFSLFRIRLNEEKCKHCGLCEKNCKARAIDVKTGTVDHSRCVVCGDCLSQCKFDALRFTAKKPVLKPETPLTEPADPGRRSFIVGTALATATATTSYLQMKADGGLAVLLDKEPPKRETPLTPPGSVSARHMQRHCTACQLCITACPNHVLRPSTNLTHFMQPTMSYEIGYCRPECTQCGQVCPSGAIKPISRKEKTAIHIGHAVWKKEFCVVLTDGVSCGNCARHCPTQAIQMREYEYNGRTVLIPSVDVEKCIGCGACENLCPSRPFSAIYVEGHEMQRRD